MPDPSNEAGRPAKLTLLGALTVAGDLLVISLLLLVFALGLVTAAPAAVGAIRARRDVSRDGPSAPAATVWRGVRENFRTLWMVGPVVGLLAAFAWIALAFWLTVPAPMSIVMIAVVTVVVATGALFALALPAAHQVGDSLRVTLRRTVLLIVRRPWASILALLAFAAAIVLAARFPAVGLVVIGGVFVEIAYRAWVWKRSDRS